MTANIALYGNCLRTSFVQDGIGEMIDIFKTLLMPVTIFKIVVLIKFGYNARRNEEVSLEYFRTFGVIPRAKISATKIVVSETRLLHHNVLCWFF